MKRIRSFRKSVAKADELLARYASRASLLDALHALSILDGDAGAPTLTELAAEHLRSVRGRARSLPRLTLGELFDRRMALYAPVQLRSVKSLGSAKRFFCGKLGADTPVETIPGARFVEALSSVADPNSWNTHFRRLRLALNWAVREKFIERSPLEGVGERRVDYREPAYFPPEKVERIFRTAEKHPGPLSAAVGMQLSLGFFAGVRTIEIQRARWEDLNLEDGLLRIPQPKGFSHGQRPRLIELEPNAAAWMRQWRDWALKAGCSLRGPIVQKPRLFERWKKEWLAPQGDSWGNDAAHKMPSAKPERSAKGDRKTRPPRTGPSEATGNCRSGNVMRHTYATMHVAAFRNAAATALNLGHGQSTDNLLRYYRGLVSQTVGAAHWSIAPSGRVAAPAPEVTQGFRRDLVRAREPAPPDQAEETPFEQPEECLPPDNHGTPVRTGARTRTQRSLERGKMGRSKSESPENSQNSIEFPDGCRK